MLMGILPARTSSQTDTEWLTLHRVSLSVSGSYHDRPWNKYNESVALEQEAFNYQPAYPSPSGSFKKIIGDAAIDAVIGYRVFGNLTINAVGGYTGTGSKSHVSWIYSPTDQPQIIQNVAFRFLEYGAGLQYGREVSDNLHVSGSLRVCRAEGIYNYDYFVDYGGQRYWVNAKLQQPRIDYRAALEVAYKVYGPLSLLSSLEYRWLKFPNLRGTGTYSTEYDNTGLGPSKPVTFASGLIQADGYFGMDPGSPFLPAAGVLFFPWSRARIQNNYGIFYGSPAILDLSGFGMNVGVRVEF